jgi:DNA (cytosine-5)-methyltransferase 1
MPKVISLFTGAGGLDLGFEAAGFDTAVAVEINDKAVETLRANRDWPVFDQDIHTVTSKELLAAGSLGDAEADILIGGPPCQPFSKSGYWASGDTLRLDDPRAGTIGAYLRVLSDTLPKTFLLENVPGLAYRSKSEGLDLIQRTIEAINRERGTDYQLSIGKLNAADYGVPQLRERVFVIGSRDGTIFHFPEPTHQPIPENGQEVLPELPTHTTAWDALGDLEDDTSEELSMRGKWADLLPSIPEGENYLFHTERGVPRGGMPLFGWRRRFWSFLLKLSKEKPSWTVQAQPGPAVGPLHWQNRRLSARELCRIQTVPDDYEILGSIADVQRQIGNAVPSALAEVLARAIRKQLLGHSVETAATLIPQPRHPVPAPEPVATVPKKYHHLVGDHEAHPGTGKGVAAEKRSEETEQLREEKSRSERRPATASLPLFSPLA